jgi:hypothetical protein
VHNDDVRLRADGGRRELDRLGVVHLGHGLHVHRGLGRGDCQREPDVRRIVLRRVAACAAEVGAGAVLGGRVVEFAGAGGGHCVVGVWECAVAACGGVDGEGLLVPCVFSTDISAR